VRVFEKLLLRQAGEEPNETVLLKLERIRLSFRQSPEFADYGTSLVEYEPPLSYVFWPAVLMRARHVRKSAPFCRYIDRASRSVACMMAPYEEVRKFSREIGLMHAAIGSLSTSAGEMLGRVGAESMALREDGEERAARVDLLIEVYRSLTKGAELGR